MMGPRAKKFNQPNKQTTKETKTSNKQPNKKGGGGGGEGKMLQNFNKIRAFGLILKKN